MPLYLLAHSPHPHGLGPRSRASRGSRTLALRGHGAAPQNFNRFISHIEVFDALHVAEVTIGDDAIPCALSSRAKPVSHPGDSTWNSLR